MNRIFKDQRQQRQRKFVTRVNINNNNSNGNDNDDEDPIALAKLAHRAEVTHFGNPGGTMDHVAIAMGSVVRRKKSNHNNDEVKGDGDVYSGCCGALRIGPDPWQVEPLPMLPSFDDGDNKDDDDDEGDNGVWILAYSGEPKDTMKHLKRCKFDRLELLERKLRGDWDYPILADDNDNDKSKSKNKTPTSTLILSETE